MQGDDSSGHVWRQEMAKRSPLAHDGQALGRLTEHDHDPAEVAYYEAAVAPDAQALDDAQRSYAGQYLRRLRRLRERRTHARRERPRGLTAYSHPYSQDCTQSPTLPDNHGRTDQGAAT